MKLLLVGFGKMGSLIYHAISKSHKNVNFFIIDSSLSNDLKLNHYSSFLSFKKSNNFVPDAILFAIKPQDSIAISEYSSFSDALILSIMASKSIGFFEDIFGKNARICRIMPNILGQYKKSTSLVCYNNAIAQKDISIINLLFSSIGDVIEISENDMNFGTIVASSMPAFLLEFLRHFYNYSIENTSIKNPQLIISSILLGLSEILKHQNDFEEIIAKVASKGGITEVGLDILKENNLIEKTIGKLIQNCILKAEKL